MPQIPSNGHLRLPTWVVSLPWVLLAMALATGGWWVSGLQRQVSEKEEANATLRRQAGPNLPPPPTPSPTISGSTQEALRIYAANTTLEMAKARGWSNAHTLIPEFLPDVVKLLGPVPPLREIAVTGLTRACASYLNHTSEQSPAFTADSRWIITRFPDGTLVFSDVNFLDPDTYVLKVGAKDFRVDAAFLYYQTNDGWQRAALRSPPDGHADIGPAETFAGTPPEPAAPPSTALIRPQVSGNPAQLHFQAGRDPALPVHSWQDSRSGPNSVILSPDGRFAAVWIQKGVIQIWRLAMLRERLAPLGLDWNVSGFPPPVNDERIEGSVKGAEPVPAAWHTAIPAQSDSPIPSNPNSPNPVQPRRRVVLPTGSQDASSSSDSDSFSPGVNPIRRKVRLPTSDNESE